MNLRTVAYAIFILFTLCRCESSSDNFAPGAQAPQKTENQEIFTLREQTSYSCPTISGRYRCVSGDGCQDKNEVLRYEVQALSGQRHFVFGSRSEEAYEDFSDYLKQVYLFDVEGFYLDGTVHNKTTLIREQVEVLRSYMQTSAGQNLRELINNQDIEAAMDRFHNDVGTTGYRASCSGNVIEVHYLLGNLIATKTTVTVEDHDHLLIQSLVALENNQPLARSETRLVRIPTEDERIEQFYQEPYDAVAATKGTYPDDIAVAIDEYKHEDGDRVHLNFYPAFNYINNDNYIMWFANGYWGEWNSMFDDVSVKILMNGQEMINLPKDFHINLFTKKVVFGKIVVGDLIEENDEYKMKFNQLLKSISYDGEDVILVFSTAPIE